MQRFLLYLIFLILPAGYSPTRSSVPSIPEVSKCQSLYEEMYLQEVINYTAFQEAFAGYSKLEIKNKGLITLIDFTKPSTEERFYVLDLENKKMLFSSLVSHGRNSGEKYATSFSNEYGSYKSSLGFYRTGNTYQGKNGYSLILDGLEKGINDRAKERAIVIHGAPYSNPSVIATGGRLGRSFGCPALPQSVNQAIINTIKEGTLLYIYANDKNYLSHSSVLSNSNSPTI